MSEWKKYRVCELCSEIVDCVNKTAPISATETPFKMLRTSDVREGFINLEGLNCVTEEVFQKWTRRGELRVGDVIFTREAPLGEVGIVREAKNYFMGQRLVLYRANPNMCDSRFLMYWFLNPVNKEGLKSRGVGSTVTHLRVPECENIEIIAPKVETQRRIADILSAYDSLIENNQKQIKLLEEAAQRLYKEWFVNLRFPGYENVKIIDGVPEGWGKLALGELISYEIGGGWGEESLTDNNEHEAYVIRGTDFEGLKNGELLSIPLRFHTASNLSPRRLKHGDIVFEVSGGSRTEGVARTARVVDSMLERWKAPVICASFCKLVRPLNEEISQYLFDHFRYLRLSKITEECDKRSASSIGNYRWKDFLCQRTVLYPDSKVLKKYNGLSVPLYDKIIALSLQIESARLSRDMLLPKLMSGEIEL